MEFINCLVSMGYVDLIIPFYLTSRAIMKYIDSCVPALSENLGYRKRFVKLGYLVEYHRNSRYNNIQEIEEYFHELVSASYRILMLQYWRVSTIPEKHNYRMYFTILYISKGVIQLSNDGKKSDLPDHINNALCDLDRMGYGNIVTLALEKYTKRYKYDINSEIRRGNIGATYEDVAMRVSKLEHVLKPQRLTMTNFVWLKKFTGSLTRNQCHLLILRFFMTFFIRKETIPYDYNLIHLLIKYVPVIRDYLMINYPIDPYYDMFLDDCFWIDGYNENFHAKCVNYYKLPPIFLLYTRERKKLKESDVKVFTDHVDELQHLVVCDKRSHICCDKEDKNCPISPYIKEQYKFCGKQPVAQYKKQKTFKLTLRLKHQEQCKLPKIERITLKK